MLLQREPDGSAQLTQGQASDQSLDPDRPDERLQPLHCPVNPPNPCERNEGSALGVSTGPSQIATPGQRETSDPTTGMADEYWSAAAPILLNARVMSASVPIVLIFGETYMKSS